MVFANLTYLDSLNRYIVLCSYKDLLGISERSLVSTDIMMPITIIGALAIETSIISSNQYSVKLGYFGPFINRLLSRNLER